MKRNNKLSTKLRENFDIIIDNHLLDNFENDDQSGVEYCESFNNSFKTPKTDNMFKDELQSLDGAKVDFGISSAFDYRDNKEICLKPTILPASKQEEFLPKHEAMQVLSQILGIVKETNDKISEIAKSNLPNANTKREILTKNIKQKTTPRCEVDKSVFKIPEVVEDGTPIEQFWTQDFSKFGNMQKKRLQEAKILGGNDKRLIFYFYEKYKLGERTKKDILRFYKQLESSAFEFNVKEIYQYFKNMDEEEKAHNTYIKRGYSAMKRVFRL
jgi:hypothetical protein